MTKPSKKKSLEVWLELDQANGLIQPGTVFMELKVFCRKPEWYGKKPNPHKNCQKFLLTLER